MFTDAPAMSVQDIIHAAADDADDYLAGISSMTEARPAIREYLKSNHPALAPADEARVIAGVLAILEEEGFFEAAAGDAALEDTGSGGGSDDEP
ncbi:MAG: hypothetical protein IAE82_19495 [Opitutaceae bacterium]|nr:hypothetical protein [Opitutaceae bacterium]